MSGPIGHRGQRPGLLPLHMLQEAFTEDKLAQLVEDQARSRVAASLTWIVRRFNLYSLGFVHWTASFRGRLSPRVNFMADICLVDGNLTIGVALWHAGEHLAQ